MAVARVNTSGAQRMTALVDGTGGVSSAIFPVTIGTNGGGVVFGGRLVGQVVLRAVGSAMRCLGPAGCGRRTGRRDRACRARSLMISEGLLGVLWAVYGGKCCPQPWVPHVPSPAAFSGPQTAVCPVWNPGFATARQRRRSRGHRQRYALPATLGCTRLTPRAPSAHSRNKREGRTRRSGPLPESTGRLIRSERPCCGCGGTRSRSWPGSLRSQSPSPTERRR